MVATQSKSAPSSGRSAWEVSRKRSRDTAMKTLLVVTAVFEGVTGVVLMAWPAPPVFLLLGTALDTPGGQVVARVAGAALLALALACWLARIDPQSRAARGLVAALLLYNVAVIVVLVYACLGWNLSAIGLWPAVGLHAALALSCAVCLH
jgi:hypothetical protein